MVKVNIGDLKEVYLDGYLKKKLDNIKFIISKNWDAVVLVDGLERCGKSTLGITIAKYLDNLFGVSNIAIDSDDAIKKLEELPDKSVLLIDEGSLVFSSKDAMKKEQRKLMKIINVIGQKNMVLIIILPSFFELNKYLATIRAKFLLHAYADNSLHRGRFAYWSGRKLRKLYEFGKKNYGSYQKPEADFVGKFVNFEPTWYKEYLQIKRDTLMSALKEKTDTITRVESKWIIQRDLLLNLICSNRWMNQTDLGKFFRGWNINLEQRTISDSCKKVEEMIREKNPIVVAG